MRVWRSKQEFWEAVRKEGKLPPLTERRYRVTPEKSALVDYELPPFFGTREEYIRYVRREQDAHRSRRANAQGLEAVDWEPLRVARFVEKMTAARMGAMAIEDRRVMLSPWMLEDHLSMLYAPPGTGKSLFALTVSIALAGGGVVRGLNWRASEAVKVLYVDAETPLQDLNYRKKKIVPVGQTFGDAFSEGWVGDLSPEWETNIEFLLAMELPVGVRFYDLNVEEDRQRLMKKCVDDGVRFVVLDNFRMLTPSMEDENSAGSVRPFTDWLLTMKKMGISVMLLHHTNRGSAGYSGSGQLTVPMETVLPMLVPEDGVRIGEDGQVRWRMQFEKDRLFTAAWDGWKSFKVTNEGYEVEGNEELQKVVDWFAVYDVGQHGKTRLSRLEVELGVEDKRLNRLIVQAVKNGLTKVERVVEVLEVVPKGLTEVEGVSAVLQEKKVQTTKRGRPKGSGKKSLEK